jgi:hypothetical protein
MGGLDCGVDVFGAVVGAAGEDFAGAGIYDGGVSGFGFW